MNTARRVPDRFPLLISLYDLARSSQAREDLADAAGFLREGLSAASDAGDESALALPRRSSRTPLHTPADNQTVRNVFVIGPDKKIKLILVYPMTTGRNFDGQRGRPARDGPGAQISQSGRARRESAS